MKARIVERFTVQIVRNDGGVRENLGYFPDAESAKLWAQALVYTRQATSATVLRIRRSEQSDDGGHEIAVIAEISGSG